MKANWYYVHSLPDGSTVLVCYYLLGGDTAAPSGLYARLCHAFLVFIIFNMSKAISISTGPIFTIFSPNGRYLREVSRILSSLVNGMFTNNQWRSKCVISAFVISQPIKYVIANGHHKLHRLISSFVAISCQRLLKLVDKCGRYSKPNQCYFRFTAWLKRPHFRVHVSPGSTETLARGGGITNHHLIAYSLSNISAKNYQNRLMCVEVIVCYISVVFWDIV